MNALPSELRACDLFVMLERAFHRKSRECRTCTFSLPFRTDKGTLGNWTVNMSGACSPKCRMLLEDLLSEFQASYRLSDTGHFYTVTH